MYTYARHLPQVIPAPLQICTHWLKAGLHIRNDVQYFVHFGANGFRNFAVISFANLVKCAL